MTANWEEEPRRNGAGGFFSKIDIKWFKLIRGLAIFITSILLLSYTTHYILENKMEVYFMPKGLEKILLDPPTFDTILLVMGAKVCVVLFIVLLTISLMAFIRGFEWRFIALLTLIFHSFMILIAFTALQIPFIMSVPKASLAVVDADMQNVTFYNVSVSGVTPEGPVMIASRVIEVGYVRAFRMYPNMTKPDWHLLDERGIEEALKNTVTYMNMSDIKYVHDGSEVYLKKLDFSTGNWSKFEYRLLLQRSSIRLVPTIAFEEYVLDIFPRLAAMGMGIYNAIGFKRLYTSSVRYAVITGAILLLVLLLFGGF